MQAQRLSEWDEISSQRIELRAIAVASVFFFHLGVLQFRGGFVGVDVC